MADIRGIAVIAKIDRDIAAPIAAETGKILLKTKWHEHAPWLSKSA